LKESLEFYLKSLDLIQAEIKIRPQEEI